MKPYIPRQYGTTNILSGQLLPGMEYADGFIIDGFEINQGSLFALGRAYGFIPGKRYVGGYPESLVTIKVQVN